MSVLPAKTLKEELISTKLDSTTQFQVSSISNNEPFVVYNDQFTLFQEYENTKTKPDPISAEVNFWYNNIDKFEELEPEFIIFWSKKLLTSHPKVLEELKEKLNIQDTALQEISDCLGTLYEQCNIIDSRYTPMFDIDLESNIPKPYNSILDIKLNYKYKTNINQASLKVNSLFNQNIYSLVQQSSPSVSHGGDLVTDITHIQRIKEVLPTLLEEVADKLKGAFESFIYISSYKLNNLQKICNAKFNKDIEGSIVQIDIKNNKVQQNRDLNTLDIIGS